MKKKITLAMLAVATAYMLQASLNVLNPIVATISTIFPGIPYETVALAATLPTLLAILGGLIADRIVARLGYKQTLILLYILMIVSGILPAFFSGSFAMMLISALLMGFSFHLFRAGPGCDPIILGESAVKGAGAEISHQVCDGFYRERGVFQ